MPKNNAPVESSVANLLDLEDQAENLLKVGGTWLYGLDLNNTFHLKEVSRFICIHNNVMDTKMSRPNI